MKTLTKFFFALLAVALGGSIGLAVYDLNLERQNLANRLNRIEKDQIEAQMRTQEELETRDKTKNIETAITEEDIRLIKESITEFENNSDDDLAAKLSEFKDVTYNALYRLEQSHKDLEDMTRSIEKDLEAQEDRDDPTKVVSNLSPLVCLQMTVAKETHNAKADGLIALSGFIIKHNGEPLILTAGHFLPEGGSVYNINCFFGDGHPSTMLEFVGLSRLFDIGVFRFKKDYEYDGRYFELGNSSLLGRLSPIIVLGSPLPFSNGVHFLSGYGYVMSPNFHSFYSGTQPSVILHWAITNSGVSGGPLLDSRGRVVGINVGVMEKRNITIDLSRSEMNLKVETNMYTATPIDDVKRVLPKILKGGVVRHGALRGLRIQSSSLIPEKDFKKIGIAPPTENSLVVVEVGKKTDAETNGFAVGDIVLAIDDIRVSHLNDFTRELAHREPKDTVSVAVERKGQIVKLAVILEAFAPSLPPVRVK